MAHGKIAIGASAFSGSSVATLFGVGYGTMKELYKRYVGEQTEPEFSEEAKKSMEFGTFFEDAVARFFAEKRGWKIKRCGDTAYWADDMPFYICHPDRLVIGRDEQGRRVALEIKCVSPYADGWGEDGSSEIPDHYYLQVQSYFACKVPCDVVYVVCMKGNRINSYEILPDEDAIKALRNKVAEAKARFDMGIVPDSDNYKEAVSEFMGRLDPLADAVSGGDVALEAWDKLQAVRSKQKQLEEMEDKLKAQLIDLMGTAPALVYTNEKGKLTKICSWSKSSRTSVDYAKMLEDNPTIKVDVYKRTTESTSVRFNYPRTKE